MGIFIKGPHKYTNELRYGLGKLAMSQCLGRILTYYFTWILRISA
ncbi:hypothetical protein Cmaq_0118 [Caldivirga maquilingensis IC-167]|uniref:Uncharacterized protein n=1 Tax=Caldivirga maquilingensis (strain ATCC 700844 / DSM 13496 / JCM 10307 / IC-167) TaxID=397948 RepID=A8MA39_CALMQ|nr:hypothetical protein Cmaq_0118 [Caldivirga maquilingensis IC-167]